MDHRRKNLIGKVRQLEKDMKYPKTSLDLLNDIELKDFLNDLYLEFDMYNNNDSKWFESY